MDLLWKPWHHWNIAILVTSKVWIIGKAYQVWFRFGIGLNSRIKSPNDASQFSHRLLKGPISCNAKRVDETISVEDISVELVKADKLVSVQTSAASQPLTSKEFSHGAGRLQRHVDVFVELTAKVFHGFRTITEKVLRPFLVLRYQGWDWLWPFLKGIEISCCRHFYWNVKFKFLCLGLDNTCFYDCRPVILSFQCQYGN